MLKAPGFRGKIALIVSFVLPISSLAPALPEGPGEAAIHGGEVFGKVVGSAGHPVPGATVLVHGVDSDDDRASAPTGGDGSYEIEGLAEGRYQIAVRTGGGIYLGAREIRVSSQERQAYSFRLRGATAEEASLYLRAAAGEEEEAGEEPKEEKKKRRRGALTPWVNPLTVTLAGVALVVGVAALIDAADGEDEEDEDGSPSLP